MRRWTGGVRVVVLVHGYSDDADTWWRVAPEIVSAGYTVLAPELRGHGDSPRADSYTFQELADDLLETLPADVDVAIGHSLGALVLHHVEPQLRPRRAVYLDPPWTVSADSLAQPVGVEPSDRGGATSGYQWSDDDARIELSSNAKLDPRVWPELLTTLPWESGVELPAAAGAESVVVVPATGSLLPRSVRPTLVTRGFSVVEMSGTGHVMHRDNHDGFMSVLFEHALRDERAA